MLADEREALEKRKLELEINELQRKVRCTTGTFVLSIVGVVVALGGVLGQNYLAEIKNEKANLAVAQAAASLKTLNDEKAKTTTEIENLRTDAVQLQERNLALSKATDTLIAVVPPSKQAETAIKATENAKYWVGPYTLGLPQVEYGKLANFLSDRGMPWVVAGRLIQGRHGFRSGHRFSTTPLNREPKRSRSRRNWSSSPGTSLLLLRERAWAS